MLTFSHWCDVEVCPDMDEFFPPSLPLSRNQALHRRACRTLRLRATPCAPLNLRASEGNLAEWLGGILTLGFLVVVGFPVDVVDVFGSWVGVVVVDLGANVKVGPKVGLVSNGSVSVGRSPFTAVLMMFPYAGLGCSERINRLPIARQPPGRGSRPRPAKREGSPKRSLPS